MRSNITNNTAIAGCSIGTRVPWTQCANALEYEYMVQGESIQVRGMRSFSSFQFQSRNCPKKKEEFTRQPVFERLARWAMRGRRGDRRLRCVVFAWLTWAHGCVLGRAPWPCAGRAMRFWRGGISSGLSLKRVERLHPAVVELRPVGHGTPFNQAPCLLD